MPPIEAWTVIVVALFIAFGVARYFAAKGTAEKEKEPPKEEESEGTDKEEEPSVTITTRLKFLEWSFTASGQVAIFLAVFLAIVTVYIILKLVP